MMATTALVRNLANEGQDFEWYPTTETIAPVTAPRLLTPLRHGSRKLSQNQKSTPRKGRNKH